MRHDENIHTDEYELMRMFMENESTMRRDCKKYYDGDGNGDCCSFGGEYNDRRYEKNEDDCQRWRIVPSGNGYGDGILYDKNVMPVDVNLNHVVEMLVLDALEGVQNDTRET